jgi:CBS domain-containing protein
MAIRSGIAIPAITLFLFGGVSHMEEEPKDPKTEVKIAIVGPLMSFALAALFWGLHAALDRGGLAGATLEYLAFVNAALGVFNLLPGFPLDGGRVFRALAWWRTGSLERGTKLASDRGKGLALGIMFLGAVEIFTGALLGGVWLLFIGMFLRGMADAGFQQLVIRRALEDVLVREVMIEEPVCVGPDATIQELIDEGFLRHGFRGFPVVEEGKLRGVISIDDVRGLSEEARRSGRVGDHMQALSEALEVAPEASLADAVAQMGSQSAPRLLVTRHGKLVGMVTKTGLARFIELKQVLESR